VPSVVTIGALLTIEGERRYNGPDSEGGSGYVSCVHADGTFDINLTVGGRLEKNVHPRRIESSNPLVTSARRRSNNGDAVTVPSLLSHNYVRPPQRERLSPNTVAADVTAVAVNDNNFSLLTTYQVLEKCPDWHPKYSNKPHPIISMLEGGKKKQPRGWARWHDAHLQDNRTKRDVKGQLTAEQNVLLVEMKRATDYYGTLTERAKSRGSKGTGHNAMLQHAFSVGKSKVNECVSKYHKNHGTTKRKQRSDAGKTLTNSTKKRDQTVTPLSYFKKFKRKHHPGEVFSHAELNAAYARGGYGRCSRRIVLLRMCVMLASSPLLQRLSPLCKDSTTAAFTCQLKSCGNYSRKVGISIQWRRSLGCSSIRRK